MSCPCHVLVFTWLLCVSDLLLDQLFLPRANDGTTPRACLTLWTYTLGLWGILSVAAPHLVFALPASDSSDIDHYFIDLALGTSRELTIKGLMQVYHCIQLPNALLSI